MFTFNAMKHIFAGTLLLAMMKVLNLIPLE